MKKIADISEIFMSYQGEGPYMGSKQLFLRFYGCNKNCVYCDTFQCENIEMTLNELYIKIAGFGEDYNELVLTGGEPLLQADIIRDLLLLYSKRIGLPVYLETNGTLPAEFLKIKDFIDIVCMDVKLPSSDLDNTEHWDVHREFLELAAGKQVILKVVVTGTTSIDDIKKISSLMVPLKNRADIILQPVTSENDDVKPADDEMLLFFRRYLETSLEENVFIMGQMHKCLGIR